MPINRVGLGEARRQIPLRGKFRVMTLPMKSVLHRWFDLPLKTKGFIVISIPLTCIVLCVAALYVFQQQRKDLNAWIVRAWQAGTNIQGVITLLVDAESGTRGFLLTRDRAYLQP